MPSSRNGRRSVIDVILAGIAGAVAGAATTGYLAWRAWCIEAESYEAMIGTLMRVLNDSEIDTDNTDTTPIPDWCAKGFSVYPEDLRNVRQ